jgi:hypothetical protein
MNRRVDLLALFSGVLFIIVGTLFLLDQKGTIQLDTAVLAPISLIVIGIGAALNSRDR